MTESARPTSIRYIIIALAVCIAVMLYIDRNCLGYITPYIIEGYGLTGEHMGFLVSAFYLTYAFCQLPGGWLADRYGTRITLATYLAMWSILTGLLGFATGFWMLVFLRLGAGVFQAGTYPASAGLIRRWVPYERRGLASAIVSLGGRLGGAIMPVLTGLLLLTFMPVSANSLVREGDILKPNELARMVLLQHSSDKPPSEFGRQLATRLLEKLTPQTRQVFVDVAGLPDNTTPANAQFVEIINGWLKEPNLFEGIDLEPIKLKLNEQALALLADSETPSNEAKRTRLNRYILEVAFPGTIRQLPGDAWQPVLMIYGVVGLVIALVFYIFSRNSPREHFLTNQAEAELIEAHEIATEANEKPTPEWVLWKSIMTDTSLWACSLVQVGTNFGWIFLVNNLALYLSEIHEIPEGRERGLMASLPFLVSLPMMLVGGWWTDQLTRRYGRRFGRCFPLASTRFVCAAAFFACIFLDNAWAIVFVLCLMSLFQDMGIPALWAYNLDVGRRNVGVVLGWGNMWGNLGAFVSPIILFRIREQFTDKKTSYDVIFFICAIVFIVIGFLSLFINADKPIGLPQPAKDDKPQTGFREGEPPARGSDFDERGRRG